MKRSLILFLAGAAMFASCSKDKGGDDTPKTYEINLTAEATQGSAKATVGDAVVTKAEAGATVKLTATAATGYKFKEWTVTDGGTLFTPTGPSPYTATTTFTMPAGDVAITAEFEVKVDPATIFGDGITAAADYASGSGTVGDPWVIATAPQLKKLVDDSQKAASSERHFLLATDILVTAAQWTPISSSNVPFLGSFDGGGHTISGLTISGTDDRVGLFYYIDTGGAVRNLTLDGVSVSGEKRVGGIVGTNCGTIYNCHVTGSVSSTDQHAGGIAGSNYKGTIKDCSVSATVSGSNLNDGGIAGQNESGTIEGCTVSGQVSGLGHVGGIAGATNESGTIKGCTVSDCTVSGGDSGFVGGIVGISYTGTIIEDCTVSGCTVSSEGNTVGGIAGYNGDTIRECRFTDASSVSGSGHVGGIAGQNSSNSTVTLCYSLASSITTNLYMGGIVGWNNNGTVSKCFWLKETGTAGDGQPDAAIGVDGNLIPAGTNTPADCASHTTETAVIAAWNTARQP